MNIKKFLFWIILGVVGVFLILYFVVPKIKTGPTSTTPFQITERDFSYTLNQFAQKPNKGLNFSQKENNLLFNVSFASGGGNFEAAKLVKQDNIYKVILYDTDGMLQNMIVFYELSGEIGNISSGNYILQIVNGNDKNNLEIIVEKQFKI